MAETNSKEVEVIRVDGNMICPTCGKPYWRHPWDEVNVDWQKNFFLHIGCDGKRLKT